MFTSWILQIVLSELFQVPATLELSGPGRDLNFYAPANPFSYGAVGYDWPALERANDYLATADPVVHEIVDDTTSSNTQDNHHQNNNNQNNIQGTAGDCPKNWRVPPSLLSGDDGGSWEYKSCAHVITEVWSGPAPKVANLTLEQVTEPPEGTGVV